MDNKKERIKTWLTEPMFTKKLDKLVVFVMAFSGALLGTFVYPKMEIPFWQFIILIILFAIFMSLIFKLLGTVWKKSRSKQN